MKTVALHWITYRGRRKPRIMASDLSVAAVSWIGSHLPAYESFGYNVVAACAIGQGRLRVTQERFGVPQVPPRRVTRTSPVGSESRARKHWHPVP